MLYESSFFFRSRLTDERKKEIIEFYNALDRNQQNMIDDMLSDQACETEFDMDAE